MQRTVWGAGRAVTVSTLRKELPRGDLSLLNSILRALREMGKEPSVNNLRNFVLFSA
jgi:hypothetical protein